MSEPEIQPGTRLGVRPILFTDEQEFYLTVFRAAGLTVVHDAPGWTLLASSAGRLALHGLREGVTEGHVDLGFETTDLTAYAAAVRERAPEGLRVAESEDTWGPSLHVTGRDGLSFSVEPVESGEPGDGATPSDAVRVHQLWVSTDVVRAAEDLVALGCRERHRATNGRTIDLDADAGAVLVHVADGGEIGATLAIDVDDLGAAHAALVTAGIDHDVIDETQGRTLKVPMPGTERLLWIGQEDDDLIGVVPAGQSQRD
jgi:hypothetical protein